MYAYALRLASFKNTKLPRKKKIHEWPHEHPDSEQLAKAGFYFNPGVENPDNVTCYSCECSLDGWEIDDCPLKEHIEHSRDCAWATLLCKSWETEKEHDPHSEEHMGIRLTTFDNNWPLDKKRGWKPTSLKLAEAGFYYAPTEENEDLVACSYCDLSLDGWERTDDPSHEHRRRRPDCFFFTSKEGPTKTKRQSKRASKRAAVKAEEEEFRVKAPAHGSEEEGQEELPIRSKKEGKSRIARATPEIRQVSVEEELAKLQREMEESGEVSMKQEQEDDDDDHEFDQELMEMAKNANSVVHILDDGISDAEPEPALAEPTPVRVNKRKSEAVETEPSPPAKRRKSSAVPAVSAFPLSRPPSSMSDASNNWEVFSTASSGNMDEDEPEQTSVIEEEDDDDFAEARENLTAESVLIHQPAQEPAKQVEAVVGGQENEEESELETSGETNDSYESAKEAVAPTDTQASPEDTNKPESRRESRAMTRSPLAVRNLNRLASAKSPASRSATPVASETPAQTRTKSVNFSTPRADHATMQWEPVDCDQVFDVCNPSPHKESEDNLDMTVSEWINYQAAQAEQRLLDKCNQMVETVRREGQRAINHIKALPTVEG